MNSSTELKQLPTTLYNISYIDIFTTRLIKKAASDINNLLQLLQVNSVIEYDETDIYEYFLSTICSSSSLHLGLHNFIKITNKDNTVTLLSSTLAPLTNTKNLPNFNKSNKENYSKDDYNILINYIAYNMCICLFETISNIDILGNQFSNLEWYTIHDFNQVGPIAILHKLIYTFQDHSDYTITESIPKNTLLNSYVIFKAYFKTYLGKLFNTLSVIPNYIHKELKVININNNILKLKNYKHKLSLACCNLQHQNIAGISLSTDIIYRIGTIISIKQNNVEFSLSNNSVRKTITNIIDENSWILQDVEIPSMKTNIILYNSIVYNSTINNNNTIIQVPLNKGIDIKSHTIKTKFRIFFSEEKMNDINQYKKIITKFGNLHSITKRTLFVDKDWITTKYLDLADAFVNSYAYTKAIIDICNELSNKLYYHLSSKALIESDYNGASFYDRTPQPFPDKVFKEAYLNIKHTKRRTRLKNLRHDPFPGFSLLQNNPYILKLYNDQYSKDIFPFAINTTLLNYYRFVNIYNDSISNLHSLFGSFWLSFMLSSNTSIQSETYPFVYPILQPFKGPLLNSRKNSRIILGYNLNGSNKRIPNRNYIDANLLFTCPENIPLDLYIKILKELI